MIPLNDNTANFLGSSLQGILDNTSTLKPTIQTFYNLLEHHFGANDRNDNREIMRLNEMNGKREIYDVSKHSWREWTDVDESKVRTVFQASYGVYSPKMLDDAIAIRFDNHRANPLLDKLNGLVWDQKPRIENFLHSVMGADDTPYIQECSRLIFAGGIHRAYIPGCKFDDMIVLIGKQGCGKSTVVRWLNMDDQYFREIKTITGKEGIEALQGAWIGEVEELLAITNVKDLEAVKAFITTQEDSYRPPYARHPVTIPRRCCFIGTTNKSQFLSDKTGNRRFYPVRCNTQRFELHQRESEIREYISQAWAEAVYRFNHNDLPPFPKIELIEDIETAQQGVVEDDWRIGAVEQYLDEYKSNPGDTISVIEVWHRAFSQQDDKKPTRKDSIEITQILDNIPGWQRQDRAEYTPWGKQKVFKRI